MSGHAFQWPMTGSHRRTRNLVNYGKVKEAVTLLEQVVKNHPSRLASQHELARVSQTNGKVEEAVSLLEEVVKSGNRHKQRIIQIN
jgi:predicted Zn-dependent protease